MNHNSINMVDTNELFRVLNQMKNYKSPGPDGLTVEFYKAYWNEIKESLLLVYKRQRPLV